MRPTPVTGRDGFGQLVFRLQAQPAPAGDCWDHDAPALSQAGRRRSENQQIYENLKTGVFRCLDAGRGL